MRTKLVEISSLSRRQRSVGWRSRDGRMRFWVLNVTELSATASTIPRAAHGWLPEQHAFCSGRAQNSSTSCTRQFLFCYLYALELWERLQIDRKGLRQCFDSQDSESIN